MLLRHVVIWFLPFMFLKFGISLAYADFRACNITQKVVGVAIGYRTVSNWTSEGWWQIKPMSCKTLIKGPLLSRFYYFYAEDSNGASRWDGVVNMCVSDSEFKINGVKNCFARGFQKFGFREIDTENQISWMVRLKEPDSSSFSSNNPIFTGTAEP